MNDKNQMSESLLLAFFLTLSGGFMDAYSYVLRGGVLANAQTGNILLLGISLSTGQWGQALKYVFPIFAFITGIAVVEAVQNKCKYSAPIHWRQIIVFAEAVILFAVSFLPNEYNLLANSLISLACGTQVHSFKRFNGHVMATTMCIGNLRTGTKALCDYIVGGGISELKKAGMFFGIIGTFALGAVLGNFGVILFGQRAIILSSLCMLASYAAMQDWGCLHRNK